MPQASTWIKFCKVCINVRMQSRTATFFVPARLARLAEADTPDVISFLDAGGLKPSEGAALSVVLLSALRVGLEHVAAQ